MINSSLRRGTRVAAIAKLGELMKQGKKNAEEQLRKVALGAKRNADRCEAIIRIDDSSWVQKQLGHFLVPALKENKPEIKKYYSVAWWYSAADETTIIEAAKDHCIDDEFRLDKEIEDLFNKIKNKSYTKTHSDHACYPSDRGQSYDEFTFDPTE